MSQAESLRIVLFLGSVAVVFCFAAVFAFRRLQSFFIKKTQADIASWTERVFLSLGVLGILCGAYGRFVEPFWPEVTHVGFSTVKLPAGTRPIRVVQISDMHSDPSVRLEDRLPAIVESLHPDLIVFTGDAINSPAGLPNFQRCMKRLAKIAPTFAVRGNWDAWFWGDEDLYRDTGVHEIVAQGEAVRIENTSLWIAGSPIGREDLFAASLTNAPTGAYTIFLRHWPDDVERIAPLGVDLYLAGHTHGGQIALPFYGALVTLSKFGKRFEAGKYRVGATDLYVNRGIGMEGGSAPRVRFCSRPEITLIEISPITR